MNRRLAPLIGIALLGALVVAALEPGLRLPLVLALAAGSWLLPVGPVRWAAAAAVPVALILAWGDLVGSPPAIDRLDCADPLSPFAWLRMAEAATVITLVLLLARHLGTTLRALGLARPSRPELLVGIAAILIIPVPSLYLGAALAEPFFGPIRLDLAQPLAVLPALTLAVANGTMEEVAYRGALMGWMSRATGPTVALIGQAVVFGAAHTGTDFVTSPLPVVLTVITGGLIAGLIVRRTGSLWLPIVVHIALDVPLYYAAACRAT